MWDVGFVVTRVARARHRRGRQCSSKHNHNFRRSCLCRNSECVSQARACGLNSRPKVEDENVNQGKAHARSARHEAVRSNNKKIGKQQNRQTKRPRKSNGTRRKARRADREEAQGEQEVFCLQANASSEGTSDGDDSHLDRPWHGLGSHGSAVQRGKSTKPSAPVGQHHPVSCGCDD